MSAGGSFGRTSVHVGDDWGVRCSAYPRELPILTVDADSSSVTITLTNRSVPTEQGVEFARELARQAERFAAECERLHAARPAAAMAVPARDEADGNAAA